MAIHHQLPIYKQGYDLLSLAADVQQNMPRAFKASLGTKIHNECVEILVLIGRANAARGMGRAPHIVALVERGRSSWVSGRKQRRPVEHRCKARATTLAGIASMLGQQWTAPDAPVKTAVQTVR